jgi:hypothetical protein
MRARQLLKGYPEKTAQSRIAQSKSQRSKPMDTQFYNR